jgi:hypothetical protein
MRIGSNSRGNPCADLQRKPPLDHRQSAMPSGETIWLLPGRDQIGMMAGIRLEQAAGIIGIRNEAAAKLLFLILNRSEKEWTMPPREWTMAKAQFAVIFGERFMRAMAA